MKDKRGFLDISFSWIFAFIVGAIILTGAIYGVNKFSSLKDTQNSAELGTALKNLLTPLETGVESTKSIQITLPVESRITHKCDTFEKFGTETFSVEEKVKNKWTNSGVSVSFSDKYIFLPALTQGQTFNIFSKSFDFPFKISNLIYFSNAKTKYCFINFQKNTETELKNTNQDNFEFNTCSSDSIKICYGNVGNTVCDVKVDPNQNSVTKEGKTVYFEGDALMYAAIFSDQTTYECEVQRLIKRATELKDIYISKSGSLAARGCSSSVDFSGFSADLSNYKNSEDLYTFSKDISDMNRYNIYSECRLW